MKYILTLLIALTANYLIGQTECGLSNDEINKTIELSPTKFDNEPNTGLVKPPGPPLPPPDGEYEKLVTWVHGMNGSSSSWSHAAFYARDKYDVKEILPDYSGDQQTMNQVTNSLFGKIEDDYQVVKDLIPADATEKCFAVGHSLGGIALKKVNEKFNPDYINGIVTFNSPHGGSKLAEYVETVNGLGNFDPAKVIELEWYIEKACQEFGAGPLKEKIEGLPILAQIETMSLGFIDISEILLDTGCGFLATLATPIVLKNVAPKCVSEIYQESPILDIDDKLDFDHRMLFYSNIVENPAAHLSAYNMFYSVNNSPDSYATFTAHLQYEEAENAYYANKNTYNDKILQYANMYDEKQPWDFDWMCSKTLLPSTSIPLVSNCLTWGDIKEIKNDYQRGLDYFQVFNDFWEYVCGAREYTILGTCECWGDETTTSEEECLTFSGPNSQANCSWTEGDLISNVLHPYDGFLTSKTQKDWKGCDKDYKYELLGPNHLQVKNTKETKWAIDEMFGGGIGPDFFNQ